jgi:glycosyltransferase involved in cell wall biosynthesis
VSAPAISVIVSTYKWPEALDVVLRALFEQSDQVFDVVVADDGSGPATGEVIRRWQAAFVGGLEHVWQHDAGWRKARVSTLRLSRPGEIFSSTSTAIASPAGDLSSQCVVQHSRAGLSRASACT